MLRSRSCPFAAAALVAAAAVSAQNVTTLQPAVVVVEHGGERIELRLPPGAKHPRVSINGKVVSPDAWTDADGKQTAEVGDWRVVATTPTGGWPMLYYDLNGNDQASQWLQQWRTRFDGAGETEPRPYLGLQVGSLPPALAEHLDLDPGRCVLILDVTADGPAAKAGVEANDILLSIDGEGNVTDDSLHRAVAATTPGDKMTLHVLRKGKERDVGVTVGKEERPNPFFTFDRAHFDPAGARAWTTPYTITTVDPRFNVRSLFSRAGDDPAPEEGDSVESLQRQIEQIKRLCDRLERQLDHRADDDRDR